jgi:hypothetical protein
MVESDDRLAAAHSPSCDGTVLMGCEESESLRSERRVSLMEHAGDRVDVVICSYKA